MDHSVVPQPLQFSPENIPDGVITENFVWAQFLLTILHANYPSREQGFAQRFLRLDPQSLSPEENIHLVLPAQA